MSNRSLTIVLPVYNGESRLTSCVNQMLELASELTSRFSILIVDDGSTDDTSTVAQELSARYPQIALRRHRHRRGLGPVIDSVRRRITSDVVIVHDGVTPIDATQVRRLWHQSVAGELAPAAAMKCDVSELAEVRRTHTAMAKAHERVLGFHLLRPQREGTATPAPEMVPNRVHAPSKPQPADQSSIGHIPPLPRPNFLSAVAQFALGE